MKEKQARSAEPLPPYSAACLRSGARHDFT